MIGCGYGTIWWKEKEEEKQKQMPLLNWVYFLLTHASSSTAQLWNSLPAQIPAIRSRATLNREVNRFMGATSSAASNGSFVSAVNAQLCHVQKNKKQKTKKQKKNQKQNKTKQNKKKTKPKKKKKKPHKKPLNIWSFLYFLKNYVVSKNIQRDNHTIYNANCFILKCLSFHHNSLTYDMLLY